jgi:hypothetical protein
LEKLHEIEGLCGHVVYHRAGAAYQSLRVRVENVADVKVRCHNRAMRTYSCSRKSENSRLFLAGASIVLGLSCSACNDLREFSTEPDEAYCGAITLGSAFRAGLSPRVQMRLELDAEALEGPDSPGRLWTFEAQTADLPERRMFEDATLRPIPPLAHDPLSRLEMGEGRERNAIYAVSPREPTAAAVLAFLSLRSDRGIEVRLLRAGSETNDDARKLIFGLFSLVKREGSCGF